MTMCWRSACLPVLACGHRTGLSGLPAPKTGLGCRELIMNGKCKAAHSPTRCPPCGPYPSPPRCPWLTRGLVWQCPQTGFFGKFLVIQKPHSGPGSHSAHLLYLQPTPADFPLDPRFVFAILVLSSGSLCPSLPHLIEIHSSPFSTPLQTQELTFTVTWMGSLMGQAHWYPVGSDQWK